MRSGGRAIESGDKRRLLSNFASLSVLQGANYVLPFITVPYLTRVLGPYHYGLIGFAVAFINYFVILTGYGFSLSATKEISLKRDDRHGVSRIFSSVLIIQTVLCVLSLILVLAIVYGFDRFRADARVYLVSFGLVVGNVLFPVWLYQGMERMKYITYINLTGRIALTAAIFTFISERNDYLLYIILSSATAVLVGVASLVCAMRVFGVRFVLPSAGEIKHEIIEGWYVFISSISIVLYTSSPAFILGLFADNTVVGYFTGADKIRQAVQGLFAPAFQTLYPYVSKLAHDSRERAVAFMRREAIAFGLIGSLVCVLVFIGAEHIVGLILGKEYAASVVLLRILAFATLPVILSNVLTIQCLLSLGLRRDYSITYLVSGTVGIAAMLALASVRGALGVSISVVFVETLVVAMTLYRLRMNGVRLLSASGERR